MAVRKVRHAGCTLSGAQSALRRFAAGVSKCERNSLERLPRKWIPRKRQAYFRQLEILKKPPNGTFVRTEVLLHLHQKK